MLYMFYFFGSFVIYISAVNYRSYNSREVNHKLTFLFLKVEEKYHVPVSQIKNSYKRSKKG